MMSVVMGIGELALNALGRGRRGRARPGRDDQGGRAGAAVTRQLLAFSRPAGARSGGDRRRLVVRELVPALRAVLGSDRPLESWAGAPTWVVADRGQLEQVLINLVANARDATATGAGSCRPPAAKLSPRGRRGPGRAAPGATSRSKCGDNGAGIDPATLWPGCSSRSSPPSRRRGHRPRPRDGRRHRAPARRLVRIDSALGRGTAVGVYLPRADAQVAPAETVAPAPSGTGERVLVVDDEAALRSLACRALEQRGYVVFQAPNGLAALNHASAHPGTLDLVLTDVVMPWMNGIEETGRTPRRTGARASGASNR